jgi:hypothetical protein
MKPIPLPAGTTWDDLAEPSVLVRVARVLADDPTFADQLPEGRGSIEVTYSQFLAWALKNRQGDPEPTNAVVAAQLSAMLGAEYEIPVEFTEEQAKRKVRTFDEKLRAVLPADWREHAEWNLVHGDRRTRMIRDGRAHPPSKTPDIMLLTGEDPEALTVKRRTVVKIKNVDDPENADNRVSVHPSPEAADSDLKWITDRRTRRKVRVVIPGLEQIYDKADIAGHVFTEPDEEPQDPEESPRKDPDG